MENHALELIAEELLNNGRMYGSELSEATGIPTWKISRLLNRAKRLGLVKSSKELRFKRGRPRKYFKPTQKGKQFFSKIVEE